MVRQRLAELGAAKAVALIAAGGESAPVRARPLQRLWCRTDKLFKFPAVYQPLPIGIVWRRRVEPITVGIGGSRGRKLRLRPSRAAHDDGHRNGNAD